MAADEATGVDDALIGGAGEATDQREIGGGRECLGELCGAFEVGEHHRRWAPAGLDELLHALEMTEVALSGEHADRAHPHRWLQDEYGSDDCTRRIAHAERDESGADRGTTDLRRHVPCHRGAVTWLEVVDQVHQGRVGSFLRASWPPGMSASIQRPTCRTERRFSLMTLPPLAIFNICSTSAGPYA